jgi:hypothetical protein
MPCMISVEKEMQEFGNKTRNVCVLSCSRYSENMA